MICENLQYTRIDFKAACYVQKKIKFLLLHIQVEYTRIAKQGSGI